MPSIPVSLVAVDPRPTAVIVQTTTWKEFPGLWPQLLDEVYRFVRGSSELASTSGSQRWQNVMLYRDHIPTVEVGVLAPRPFAPEGRVIASQLPGGRTATAVHHGDYAQLGATHDAVRDYVAGRGLDLAGPRWEIYGHWRANPVELETEVYYLLR